MCKQKSDSPSVDIGERVKKLRQDAGLTQAALAEKIGFRGSPAVSNIEKGRSQMGPGVAERVAVALGVDVTYLLTGRHSDSPPVDSEFAQRAAIAHAGASPEARAILEASVDAAIAVQRRGERSPSADRPLASGRRRIAKVPLRKSEEGAK